MYITYVICSSPCQHLHTTTKYTTSMSQPPELIVSTTCSIFCALLAVMSVLSIWTCMAVKWINQKPLTQTSPTTHNLVEGTLIFFSHHFWLKLLKLESKMLNWSTNRLYDNITELRCHIIDVAPPNFTYSQMWERSEWGKMHSSLTITQWDG